MQTRGLFSDGLSFLERSLDLRVNKQRVLAADIANADTPNFRSFDVMVEEALNKARTLQEEPAFRLVATDRRHMTPEVRSVPKPDVRELPAPSASLRTDGNTVDVDREMGSLARNQILYNTSVEVISRELRLLKNVIKGG